MFRLDRLLCTNLVKIISRSVIWDSSHYKTGTRDLMSAARLSMDRYAADRKKIGLNLQEKEDHFKDKMLQVIAKNSPEFVFTNDIKIMLHIAKNEDDLEILKSMLNKYCQPNSQLRFSNYNIGPIVMRLLYFLNKPQEALTLLEDKDIGKIFNQLTSFLVLLDLLFRQGLYEEVIKVFNIMMERQLTQNRFNRECAMIFFAACYKLNTTESYKEAEKVWTAMNEVQEGKIWYRTKLLFALLAVNQNHAGIGVEILSNINLQRETLNVYVLSLAKLGNLDDALSLLRSFLLKDSGHLAEVFLTKDIVKELDDIFSKDEVFAKTFKDLIEQYKMHNLLSEKVLDDYLLEEVPPVDNISDRSGEKSREFRPYHQKNRFQYR